MLLIYSTICKINIVIRMVIFSNWSHPEFFKWKKITDFSINLEALFLEFHYEDTFANNEQTQ